MKTLYGIIIILSLAPTFSPAQNFYCKKFGTSSEELINFLNERKQVTVDVRDESAISISTSTFSMTYNFHHDQLCMMTINMTFHKKKEAEEAYKNFLEYYRLSGAEIAAKEHHPHIQFTAASSNTHHYNAELNKSSSSEYILKCEMSDLHLSPSMAQMVQESHNSLHNAIAQ